MQLCYSIGMSNSDRARAEVLQGTLDLMVLQTLDSLGPQHGYAIAARLEQVSGGALQVNMGTLYPALMRLEQRGWLRGQWSTTEANRRARFYAITAAGRRQLAREVAAWDRMAAIIQALLHGYVRG
jgi:PadR family transcriptional regulator PadR